MLYDRVMKNMQNRHKRIKHMNSSINARLQRRLRKFAENPLSGFRVSGLTYELGPGSRVSPSESWDSGPTFRISHKKTEGWYIEWQRMTTSGTTSNTEWYNKWQRITTSDNEWSFRLNLFCFFFEWERNLPLNTLKRTLRPCGGP